MSTLHLQPQEQFIPLGDSATWRDQAVIDANARVPRIVWACGETFSSPRLSLASELLRFGFKEWAGIRSMEAIHGLDAQGSLTRDGVAELLSATRQRNEVADLPIVLCRDVHAPARIVEQAASAGRVSLAYLGAPEDPELRLRRWPFRPAVPPIPMPAGLTPDSLVWLGVSAECEAARGGGRDRVAEHLGWMTGHLRRTAPLEVWLVVHIDKLRLGRFGPAYLDEAVVAALMRWAQDQCVDCGVILLSEGKAPAVGPTQIGAVAQLLGQAMHRRKGASGFPGVGR